MRTLSWGFNSVHVKCRRPTVALGFGIADGFSIVLKISSLKQLGQMLAQPHGQGNDSERWVGRSRSREDASISDKEIAHFMRLAVPVNDTIFWQRAHPKSTKIVSCGKRW